MADFIRFDLKILGSKSSVEEMVTVMKGDNQHTGWGRLLEFNVLEFNETQFSGVYEAVCYGKCAISIKSSMRDDGVRYSSLEGESERLGLVVEGYSSSPDAYQFQEHVLIVRGDVVVDDCVHYDEYLIDGYASIEDFNERHGTMFTKDMVNSDGKVCIGGFGDKYLRWRDATDFFEEVSTKDMNSMADKAADLLMNNSQKSLENLDSLISIANIEESNIPSNTDVINDTKNMGL